MGIGPHSSWIYYVIAPTVYRVAYRGHSLLSPVLKETHVRLRVKEASVQLAYVVSLNVADLSVSTFKTLAIRCIAHLLKIIHSTGVANVVREPYVLHFCKKKFLMFFGNNCSVLGLYLRYANTMEENSIQRLLRNLNMLVASKNPSVLYCGCWITRSGYRLYVIHVYAF